MNTKPVTILVIDGDTASCNYLSAIFQKSGYVVFSTSLGREGLISAWKEQPELIILDPDLPDLPGLELVKRLRQDRRTASVPCVAFTGLADPQAMTALLSAGCNEYIVKSGDALPRILELIPRLLGKKETPSRKNGILVAFLSAKGGTGTSSLCANIATCLGSDKKGSRVAVVDMVLPIGSIADIVGYDEKLNLVTAAMQNPDQVTAAFFKDKLPRIPDWNFHLLAGSPNPEFANQLAVNRLDEILGAILESYNFVLVDMGRGLSRISLPIIQKSDVVVLVVATDLSTGVLTRTVWEYLKNQGVDPQRLYTIQNRAVGLEGLTKAELEQMTGIKIMLTMPYIGGNFTLANNRHEPIILKFPNESSALTLKQAASQITELAQRSNG